MVGKFYESEIFQIALALQGYIPELRSLVKFGLSDALLRLVVEQNLVTAYQGPRPVNYCNNIAAVRNAQDNHLF